MSVLGGVTGAVAAAGAAGVGVQGTSCPCSSARRPWVLTVFQPRLNRRLAGHVPPARFAVRAVFLTPIAVYITGVYGGYFGARARGSCCWRIFGRDCCRKSLHRSNAPGRNVLAGTVNGVRRRVLHRRRARRVGRPPAAIIAVTSIVGAQIGAPLRAVACHPKRAARALVFVVVGRGGDRRPCWRPEVRPSFGSGDEDVRQPVARGGNLRRVDFVAAGRRTRGSRRRDPAATS